MHLAPKLHRVLLLSRNMLMESVHSRRRGILDPCSLLSISGRALFRVFRTPQPAGNRLADVQANASIAPSLSHQPADLRGGAAAAAAVMRAAGPCVLANALALALAVALAMRQMENEVNPCHLRLGHSIPFETWSVTGGEGRETLEPASS